MTGKVAVQAFIAAKCAAAAYIADHEHVPYLVPNAREKGAYAPYGRPNALTA